jgi:hypothetical protein
MTYWGVEIQLHTFLTLALQGDELSTSGPGRLTPGEKPSVPTGLAAEPV